jgi:hypothetical protein
MALARWTASGDDVDGESTTPHGGHRMASITHWRRRLNTQLLNDPLIDDALSPRCIEDHCRDAHHTWRESFWSPSVTILTFLLQVLNPSKTLRAAVADLLLHLAARGATDLPSSDPAAYCQARRRLPGESLAVLLHEVAQQMRGLVTQTTGWLTRRVWVVDGSTVSMPDTPELQERFPQPPGQAPGCGFPMAQFVALFCWTTGAIHDVAIDSIRPHELTLWRTLWHHLAPGDVVLADRAYSAYVDMARLLKRGVFCVFRLHQRRAHDFRAGRRLGTNDRLVTWTRPAQWFESFGVTREEFDQLPEMMNVRLVRITQAPRGFRSRTIVVATTLTDPVETPADQIRSLYRDRWTAELNFRSLKIALGMDILRGHSVDVVTKEIVMHLLAYNLIRLLMWHAARQHGRDLHRLSFTGTLHRLHVAMPLMLLHGSRIAALPGSCAGGFRPHAATLRDTLLANIAADQLPDRPDRYEPRRVKRRPKQYSRLTHPRAWHHARLDHSGR